MDTFTRNHLQNYADFNCFSDERDEFIRFVSDADADDLAYFMEVGWPVALNNFRSVYAHRVTAETGQLVYIEGKGTCLVPR